MITFLRLSVLGLVIFTTTAQSISFAEEGTPIEQLITEAKTPEEYEGIAAYYEQAAQRARENLRRYERERAIVAKHTGPVRHSGAIAFATASIAHAEWQAKEYEQLSVVYHEKANALRLQNPQRTEGAERAE